MLTIRNNMILKADKKIMYSTSKDINTCFNALDLLYKNDLQEFLKLNQDFKIFYKALKNNGLEPENVNLTIHIKSNKYTLRCSAFYKIFADVKVFNAID